MPNNICARIRICIKHVAWHTCMHYYVASAHMLHTYCTANNVCCTQQDFCMHGYWVEMWFLKEVVDKSYTHWLWLEVVVLSFSGGSDPGVGLEVGAQYCESWIGSLEEGAQCRGLEGAHWWRGQRNCASSTSSWEWEGDTSERLKKTRSRDMVQPSKFVNLVLVRASERANDTFATLRRVMH